MFTKLIQAHKRRKLEAEFLTLDLNVMAAHANAEFSVIKAQRSLADAEVKAERMNDDALMHKRWETERLNIIKQHQHRATLPREEENFVHNMYSTNMTFDQPAAVPMPKVVPIKTDTSAS